MALDDSRSLGLEFFPIDIGTYRHHDDLDTAAEVSAVQDALAPFSPRTALWEAPAAGRDAGAVEERLSHWAHPSRPVNTFLYWVGHGESNDDRALLAHAVSPRPLLHSGITPEQILAYLTARLAQPDGRDHWAIVVIDACRSDRFVELLSAGAHLAAERPYNFLLVATSTRSTADLGSFSRALHAVLNTTFAADSVIDLRDLATELGRSLRDCPVLPHTSTGRALLRRAVPTAAGAITTTLDLLTEIQAVIDQLPPDEQRHFLPKAAGADLGEQSWHFEGREEERDVILDWLDTTDAGLLTVTGAAGAGKSALLGHVLLHFRPQLRELLLRGGHLSPLPPGTPCPDDPFDAVLHLSGATAQQAVDRLAEAAGLAGPPSELSASERIDWLLHQIAQQSRPFTILLDALDEAADPLLIANRLIRPLSSLPQVRAIVGTRSSAYEDPDLRVPPRTEILDALRPSPEGSYGTTRQLVITRDSLAMTRYIRRRLTHATQQNILFLQPRQIEQAAIDLGHSGQEFLHARLAVHEILHDPAQVDDLALLRTSTHRELFARASRRLANRSADFGPLLQALALAQGRGLPIRDGVWAAAASALRLDSQAVSDESIHALTDAAAPYLVVDTEAGQTVYRLAHRTFTEFFTSKASDHHDLHYAIAKALTVQADAKPSGTALNPYVVNHLSAHVAQAGQLAWEHLARYPLVLDRIDVGSLVTEFMMHAFGRSEVPLAVAGAIATQHHAATSPPEDRAGLRELGMALTSGTYQLSRVTRRESTAIWSVRWAHLLPQPLHLTLHGHDGGVWATAPFTAADGRRLLATAADDHTVRIWDPLNGQAVGQPMTHERLVGTVAAFDANDRGALLASADDAGTVHVWDPLTGRQVAEHRTGHDGSITATAPFISSDSRSLLATAGDDGTVRILDPLTGQLVGEPLTGHRAGVLSVAAFTGPDDQPMLASGSSDGEVRLWDVLLGRPVGQPLIGHEHRVWALVAFHGPDKQPLLASGSQDHTVRVWDPLTGRPVGQPLTGHGAGVLSVAAFTAPDGRTLLAIGSGGGKVHIGDPLGSGNVGWPLTGHLGATGTVAAFTAPDGRALLATGSEDRTVRVWDPQAKESASEPVTGHETGVLSMTAFTASDGQPLLATGDYAGTVRVWNLETGNAVGHLTGDQGLIEAMVAFPAPGGRTLLAVAIDGHTVQVWDVISGQALGQPLIHYGSNVLSLAACTAPSGRPLLATGTSDGEIRVWDALTGHAVGGPLVGHCDWVRAMSTLTAPDGRRLLATTGNDRTVRVWDLKTGEAVGEPMVGHRNWVRAIASFTGPDGRLLLATAGNDGTVWIWDPLTGRAVGPPRSSHKDSVAAMVAFEPDGERGVLLATGGTDTTVRIWDPFSTASWTLPLGVTAQSIACVGRDLAVAGPEGLVAVRWRGHLALPPAKPLR
ncbi:AAA family ATPase [Streptomyces niveus]|uniref:Orc1-like AAA ATPase domain-containing protein n=1 Tax=Streptomyces niveus TaxID=193462 RepID=A0ABZ2A7V8_STRNV|nr:AAA family ATPase [Streptomyces niveus]